jgi:predicted nucleotidyltransferase
MPAQVDASKLRRDLFTVLNRLPIDGPVEVKRHGRTVAMLVPPPPEVQAEKPKIDSRRVSRLCKKHHIRRLAIFGSILRDDFNADSDIDLLYDPEPGHGDSLHEYMNALNAFTALFGRRVDFVKRAVIEGSRNKIRRTSILGSAQVIYEAK